MEKLKSCPFCGGKADIEYLSMGEDERFSPYCRLEVDGSCIMGEAVLWYDFEEQATAAWNKRVEE